MRSWKVKDHTILMSILMSITFLKALLTLWLTQMTCWAMGGRRCLKRRYAANTLMSVKYCSQLRRMMVSAASTHRVTSWYSGLCILPISWACFARAPSSWSCLLQPFAMQLPIAVATSGDQALSPAQPMNATLIVQWRYAWPEVILSDSDTPVQCHL